MATEEMTNERSEAETGGEQALAAREETAAASSDGGASGERGPNTENGGSLKGRIEAILFVAGDAVELKERTRTLNIPKDQLMKAISELESEYDFNQRGFKLKRFGDKIQLGTRALYASDVIRLLQPVQKQSVSQAAMETRAVIAYRQPVTRAEIEEIRGVKCDYSLQSLSKKGLIQEVGRRDTVGRPVLFGTTDEFLTRFGIESLEELPPLPTAEGEAEAEAEHEELIP